jgi:hypothetical protein
VDELTQQLEQLRRSVPPSGLTLEVVMDEHRRRRRNRRVIAVGASVAAIAGAIAVSVALGSDHGDELPPVVTDSTVKATSFTRIGGAGDDFGGTLVAPDGHLVVVASTDGPALTATAGALSLGEGGKADVVVSRLADDGSVEWTARLGGPNNEDIVDAAIDGDGRVVLLMHNPDSESGDLPRTPGAYGERFGGRINVARLTRDGKTLDLLAAIGGSGEAIPRAMTFDRNGDMVIVGTTDMSNFGADDGASAKPLAVNQAFVARLSADGRRLTLAEVFGGSGSDVATDVARAPDGTIVVAGATTSRDFPTSDAVAHPTSRFDESGGFVVALDPTSGARRWSTYVSDIGFGYINSVAVDAVGDIVVAGDTYGDNGGFPVTPGSFDVDPVTSGHGAGAHFVAKLASDGSVMRWASYVGRWDAVREYSSGVEVAVGPSGSIFVVGDGDDSDGGLRVTPDAVQPDYGGGTRDAFVVVISPDGTEVEYASYMGGGGDDGIGHVSFGASGESWLTVNTDSTTWLTGVVAGATRGGSDMVIVRLAGL